MKKIKILLCTDSPCIHSGFSTVVRNIFLRLYKTGKYEIFQQAWWHRNPMCAVPWEIIPTETSGGDLTKRDKYGQHTFHQIIYHKKPDIVWTIADAWMIEHIPRSPYRSRFHWIHYCPVDSEPYHYKWIEWVSNADKIVSFGKYGSDVLKAYGGIECDDAIFHGVDTQVFKPCAREAVSLLRRKIYNAGKDDIVIGCVGRNQPRKYHPALILAAYHLMNGEYYRCKKCHSITRGVFNHRTRSCSKPNACYNCVSKNIERGKRYNNIIFYDHTPLADPMGWDLIEISNRYGLHKNRFHWNTTLNANHGRPVDEINAMYNTFDIFTLPTLGEGFGLPILEAMACGVPVCVPNCTAHPEWCSESGQLVETDYEYIEPMSNVHRPMIDINDYILKLSMLIDDRDMRRLFGINGIKKAQTMDWDIISDKWDKLISNVYNDSKGIKSWQKLTT